MKSKATETPSMHRTAQRVLTAHRHLFMLESSYETRTEIQPKGTQKTLIHFCIEEHLVVINKCALILRALRIGFFFLFISIRSKDRILCVCVPAIELRDSLPLKRVRRNRKLATLASLNKILSTSKRNPYGEANVPFLFIARVYIWFLVWKIFGKFYSNTPLA